jgi:hypothetical protein
MDGGRSRRECSTARSLARVGWSSATLCFTSYTIPSCTAMNRIFTWLGLPGRVLRCHMVFCGSSFFVELEGLSDSDSDSDKRALGRFVRTWGNS